MTSKIFTFILLVALFTGADSGFAQHRKDEVYSVEVVSPTVSTLDSSPVYHNSLRLELLNRLNEMNEVRVLPPDTDEAAFRLDIVMRVHPGNRKMERLVARVTDPRGVKRYATVYFHRDDFEVATKSARALQHLANHLTGMLLTEVGLKEGERLKDDPSKNLTYLEIPDSAARIAFKTPEDMKKKQKTWFEKQLDPELKSEVGEIMPGEIYRRRVEYRPDNVPYASFKLSGLQGLFLTPSLYELDLQDDSRWGMEAGLWSIREKFNGSGVNLDDIAMDGHLAMQTLSFVVLTRDEVSFRGTVTAGIHQSDIHAEFANPNAPATTDLLNSGTLEHSVGDFIMSLNTRIQAGRLSYRPGIMAKFPVGNPSNLLTTNNLDWAPTLAIQYKRNDNYVNFRGSYVLTGDADLFTSNMAKEAADVFAFSLGAAKRFDKVSGMILSMNVNYMGNPCKNWSEGVINELSDFLLSTGICAQKRMTERTFWRLEAGMGVTPSTPDFSLGFSIRMDP